jgi:hypothetical protein
MSHASSYPRFPRTLRSAVQDSGIRRRVRYWAADVGGGPSRIGVEAQPAEPVIQPSTDIRQRGPREPR